MLKETIEQIQTRLTNYKNANSALNGLTSPSMVSAWSNFLNVIATEIFTLEQNMNLFESNTEAFIALAAPAIAQWIRAKVLAFQYNANPAIGVVSLVDFIATYAQIDIPSQIVTQCAVLTAANRTINIKVAKTVGGVLTPLIAGEITALTAYLDYVIPAGLKSQVISLQPDQIYVGAHVFYNGQYASTIQANVITAITNYLAGLPFNGIILVSAIEQIILGVPGITDVVIDQVSARANSTPLGSGTIIGSDAVRSWQTVAGYAIPETTGGQTLLTSLIFAVG